MKNDKENLDTELRAERVKCSLWKGNSHQSILDTVVQLFDSEVPYLASRFNTRTQVNEKIKRAQEMYKRGDKGEYRRQSYTVNL